MSRALGPALLVLLAGCAPRESTTPEVRPDPTAGTAPLAPTAPAVGDTTTGPTTPAGPFSRAVVARKWPITLWNPQREAVEWPVWGGAFTLPAGEPVFVSASMVGGSEPGARGLSIAGPGDPADRAEVTLAWDGGVWILRETTGGAVVAQAPLPAAETGELVLEVEVGRVRVLGTTGEATLALSEPLTTDLEAVGLYVSLDPGTSLSVAELSVSQALPDHAELGTPLRGLADARGVDMGTATHVGPPLHDLGFESLLGAQFGRVAPTEFSWSTSRGEDADWFLLPADLMVNHAAVHEQAITGMSLVWDSELPTWLTDLASSHDPDTLQAVLDDHVTTLVSRYRGRVHTWVVVNEAVWGPHDWWGWRARYASTLWFDNLGPQYIERAFVTARAADPDAVLIYNETGAEELNEKSDFVYAMLADFVSRGVPVDAVGLQFHVSANRPPDADSVRANLERFAALGLEVYLTEVDVSLVGLRGTEEERLARQSEVYGRIVDLCLAVPACESLTVSGIGDRHAWDEPGDASPLLFDEEYQPKPAFFAVQSALAE